MVVEMHPDPWIDFAGWGGLLDETGASKGSLKGECRFRVLRQVARADNVVALLLQEHPQANPASISKMVVCSMDAT